MEISLNGIRRYKFFHWIWFFNIQCHEGGNSGDTLFWITFYRVDILIISCFFHFCNPKNHFCNESMFVYFPWFLVNQIFEFLFEWLLCFFKCFFFRFASVWSSNIRSRSFAHANSFGNQFPLGQFNWSHGLCHGQRSRRGRLRMVQPSLHRIWWLMSRPRLLLADVEFRFPFIHSKWDNSVNYSFDLMKFQFLKSIRFRSWTNETLFHFIFLFLFIYLFIRCDTVMVTVHSDDKGLVLLPNVGSVQVNDWSFKKVISQINNIYLKNQLNKIKGDHRSLRYLCERYRGGEI